MRRSYWFNGYQARVRAQVHAYAQVAACERLVLVCIEGGAITQLEESVMHELMAEAVRDLQGGGHKGEPVDVAVEKKTLTFDQFKARFPVGVGVGLHDDDAGGAVPAAPLPLPPSL